MSFLFSVGLPYINPHKESPPSPLMVVTPDVEGAGGIQRLDFRVKKKKIQFQKKNSNLSDSVPFSGTQVGEGVVNQRGHKRFKCWRVLQKALIFHSPRASKFAKHLIGWAYQSRKALGWLPSPEEDLGKIPSLSSMEGYETVV